MIILVNIAGIFIFVVVITMDIKNILKTSIQKTGKKSLSYSRRICNIHFIQNLERDGLIFGTKERQMLIHTTKSNENLYIHYPGKEVTRNKPQPWDFRPVIYRQEENEPLKPLSFGAIWAAIFENINKISDKDYIRSLAMVFYRMAFMIDHKQKANYLQKCRNIQNKKTECIEDRQLGEVFLYEPNQSILDFLGEHSWAGMSLEAFLYYNDLLLWNEDCKYYYRSLDKKQSTKKDGKIRAIPWINKTGRINTALTHIKILGYFTGDITLDEIFDGFAKSRGVSAADDKQLEKILKGYFN